MNAGCYNRKEREIKDWTTDYDEQCAEQLFIGREMEINVVPYPKGISRRKVRILEVFRKLVLLEDIEGTYKVCAYKADLLSGIPISV